MIVLRDNRSSSLFALGSKTAICASSKFLLEFVDTSSRINVLQLSGVKRMTLIANVDLQFGPYTAGLECGPTTAGNRRLLIIGVNAVFHGFFQIVRVGWLWLKYSAIEPRIVR